jgi:hypothetical protein
VIVPLEKVLKKTTKYPAKEIKNFAEPAEILKPENAQDKNIYQILPLIR